MQRALLSTVVAVMVVFVFGCAYTNYPVIDDSEQTNSSAGTHIVNTSGQALIVPETQVVTFYPDSADELLSYVNQDADGDQVIYTHNNFCEVGEPCYGGDWFAGMTFLNADRTGCWIWKAQNPVVGDTDIFDGQFNGNCSGARSLFLLLSAGARFAEAGSDGGNGKNTTGGPSPLSQDFISGVSIVEAVQAFSRLDEIGVYGDYTNEYGLTGWKISLTPENSELWLDNTRFMVDGLVVVYDLRNRRLAVDFRTGNTYDMLNQLADWIDLNGRSAVATISIAGISPALNVGFMDSDHYRAMAARVAG